MAKSIRSKRKRMLRSIKRERYAVKEMIRLKKMLGIEDKQTINPPIGNRTRVREFFLPPRRNEESEIKEEECIVDDKNKLDLTITEKGKLIVNVPSDDDDNDEENNDVVNVDADMSENVKVEQNSTKGETEMEHSHKRMYDPKTMKDQFGRYPAWYRQKDIKKLLKKIKLKKNIEEKREKLKEIANKKMKSQKPKHKKRKGRTGKQSQNVRQSNDV